MSSWIFDYLSMLRFASIRVRKGAPAVKIHKITKLTKLRHDEVLVSSEVSDVRYGLIHWPHKTMRLW